MTPSAVLESVLYVSDLAAAEHFYGEILGLAPAGRVDGRHAFFKCGGSIVLLFNADATRQPPHPDARLPVPPHGAVGAGHLCFAATEAEIDAWKTYLTAHDVAIEAEFEWPKGGRSIYFRDPSGNSLEFANKSIWGL